MVDDSVEDKPSVDGVVDDVQATDHTNVGAIVLVTDDTNVGVDSEVTEPFPGGPTHTSLLKSFKSHVAAAVWNNEVFLVWVHDNLFRNLPAPCFQSKNRI